MALRAEKASWSGKAAAAANDLGCEYDALVNEFIKADTMARMQPPPADWENQISQIDAHFQIMLTEMKAFSTKVAKSRAEARFYAFLELLDTVDHRDIPVAVEAAIRNSANMTDPIELENFRDLLAQMGRVTIHLSSMIQCKESAQALVKQVDDVMRKESSRIGEIMLSLGHDPGLKCSALMAEFHKAYDMAWTITPADWEVRISQIDVHVQSILNEMKTDHRFKEVNFQFPHLIID